MTTDPFGVLGVAATMDLGVIKRAYFAALRAHPPHSDPEGFALVRAAYEALQPPTGRATAVLSAPLDVAAALHDLEARSRPAGRGEATANEATDDEGGDAVVAATFVRGLVGMPWKTAVERFRAARSSGG